MMFFRKEIIFLLLFLNLVSHLGYAQTKLPFQIVSCKYCNTSSGIKNGGTGVEYFLEIKFQEKTTISFDSASVNGVTSSVKVTKGGNIIIKNTFKKKEKVILRYGYLRNIELPSNKYSYIFYTYKNNNLVLETNGCEYLKSVPRP